MSSRVQSEHCLGAGVIMEAKSSFKQCQLSTAGRNRAGLCITQSAYDGGVRGYTITDRAMCYHFYLTCYLYNSVMSFFGFSPRKAYRTLGLFWAGSLCANMSVFIAGIVAGEPHLLFPLYQSRDDKL